MHFALPPDERSQGAGRRGRAGVLRGLGSDDTVFRPHAHGLGHAQQGKGLADLHH